MANNQVNIDLKINAAESAKTLKEQKLALRALRDELAGLEEGTDAFNRVARAAGNLQDTMGDLRAATQFYADDVRNISGAIEIGEGIAASFGLASSAMELLGVSSGKTEEVIKKFQVIQTTLTSLQSIGNLVQRTSAANMLLTNNIRKVAIALIGQETIATAKDAVAKGTAGIAQRALNAAMNANPMVAVIGLVVALTSAYVIFGDEVEDVAAKQKKLNEEQERTNRLKLAAGNATLTLAASEAAGEVLKLENKIKNAKSLKEELALLKDLKIAKEKQAKIDLETDLLAKKFGPNKIDDIKKVIKANIENNNAINNVINNVKKLNPYLTFQKEEFLKYMEFRKNGYSKDVAEQKSSFSLMALNSTETDSKMLSEFESAMTKKYTTLSEFTKKTEINFKDVQLALEEQKTQGLITEQEYKNALTQIEIEINDRKKQAADEWSKSNKKNKSDEVSLAKEIRDEELKKIVDEEKRDLQKLENDKITRKADIKAKVTNKKEESTLLELIDKNYITDKADIENKYKLQKEQLLRDEVLSNANANLSKLQSDKQLAIDELEIQRIIAVNEATSEAERTKINNKYAEDLYNIKISYIDKEKKAIKDKTDLEIADLQAKNKIIQEDNSKTEEEKKANAAKTAGDIKKLEENKNSEIKKLDKDLLNEKLTNAELEFQKKQAIQKKLLDLETQLANDILTLYKAQSDIRISGIEKERDARLKAYDEMIVAQDMVANNASIEDYQALARQQEITQQRAQIEYEYNAKVKEEKRKQFQADKLAKGIQATINTAVAVTEVLANPILAAIVGIAGALQVAAIAAQPVPQFATGGLVSGPGGPTDDKINAKLSNGESVINAKSTKMFAPLLSAINEAGGGVSFAPKMDLSTVSNSIQPGQDMEEIKQILREYKSKPILTYVDSQDVTRAQKNRTRLERKTTF